MLKWINAVIAPEVDKKWAGELESYLYCEFVRLRTAEMFSLF